MGMGTLLGRFPIQLGIAAAAVVSLGVVFGAMAGPYAAAGGFRARVTAAGMTVGCLLVGTALGAWSDLIIERPNVANLGGIAYARIAKPLSWVLLFGWVFAVGLGVLYVRLVARWASGVAQRPLRHRTAVAVCAGAVMLSPPVANVAFMDREETVQRTMRWMERGTRDAERGIVTLVFVRAPHYYQTVESPSLQSWLRQREQGTVEATFSITRDFGRVRSIRLDRIEGWPNDPTPHVRRGGWGCGAELAPCDGTAHQDPW
jgi:hypothetical protein